MIKIFAPATSANLRVGFDSLGIALQPIDGTMLGDFVTIEESDKIIFEMTGKYAHLLPTELENNLCYHAFVLFSKKLSEKGISVKPFKLTLDKNMPIGSGLGSSSSSIVATICALNDYSEVKLSNFELLNMMGELEGIVSNSVHFDNVAPSFLGGMQLILADKNQISASLPSFDNWYWILAYSGVPVSTAKARATLPSSYERSIVLKHATNLSTFIHACHTHDEQLAKSVMIDYIAEPYRESLLVNYQVTKERLHNAGAKVVGISGSGPTIFTIASTLEEAREFEQIMRSNYFANDEAFCYICKEDKNGARLVD